MKIIGLTGGIASGKNFVASIFEKKGAAIFDADREVHEILINDKRIISKIGDSFPDAVKSGVIDRNILGKIVFSDKTKLSILEKILHLEVRKKQQKFILEAKQNNKKIAILNIPLLLEKEGYECDKIISLVIAPSIQRRRFLTRVRKLNPKKFLSEKKNLEKKFQQIRSHQISNSERKKRSDFVINTGFSKAYTIKQIEDIIKK